MKIMSKVFVILAVLLSDVMCAAVAYNYTITAIRMDRNAMRLFI